MVGQRSDDATRHFAALARSRRALLRWAGTAAFAGLRLRDPMRAGAASVDDAQCAVPAQCCAGFGRERCAQSFKAKNTGELTQATVQLSRGSQGVINSYLIEIRKASHKGKPTTEVLASFQTPLMDRPQGGDGLGDRRL